AGGAGRVLTCRGIGSVVGGLGRVRAGPSASGGLLLQRLLQRLVEASAIYHVIPPGGRVRASKYPFRYSSAPRAGCGDDLWPPRVGRRQSVRARSGPLRSPDW